jgi:hypothetical protein
VNRRSFLRTGVSGSFLAGAAAGAAGGVAGTLALAPRPGPRAPALPAKLSYAQQGEDLALWQIAHGVLGLERPTYLDIGAHHPTRNSNTFLFYEAGCRGVLVEPNPVFCDLLAAVRPRDALLRAGIGVSAQREADYYVIGGSEDAQLNTFSREQAEALVTRSRGRYTIERVLRIPLLDVNDVMREHWNGAPNVVSIDTEGFDLPILKSVDFGRFRPDVLCVETIEIGARRLMTEIVQLVSSKGYEARGGSFVNTIFVDRRHVA